MNKLLTVLTLKVFIMISDVFVGFFFFFSEKKRLSISCESS